MERRWRKVPLLGKLTVMMTLRQIWPWSWKRECRWSGWRLQTEWDGNVVFRPQREMLPWPLASLRSRRMTRTSETYLTEEGTAVLRGRRSKMASTRTSTSTLTRRRRRLPGVGRGMSSPMTNFSTILRRTMRIRCDLKDRGCFYINGNSSP